MISGIIKVEVSVINRSVISLTSHVTVRPSVHTDSVGGGGLSQDNPTGLENAIFSWWEIAWCFWATSGFLGW